MRPKQRREAIEAAARELDTVLAESMTDEVLLAELVNRGTLTEETCEATPDYDASRRFVTQWEASA